MRYAKTLGLLVTTVGAMMVFAASASADYVTTTTGGAASTPTIHAVNENGHVVISDKISAVSCSSTLEGSVVNHGSGLAVAIQLSQWSFTTCTNSQQVKTDQVGSLSVEWTSGHNGTVISTGSRFTITRFGIPCVYDTNNTHLGTITGGNPATLDISASIPMNTVLSDPLCGSGNAKLAGQYVLTSALYVVNS